MNLVDYLNPQVLSQHLDAGYVRRQKHPDGDLWILNYTEKCQYERVWDDVTKKCRGLIVGGPENAYKVIEARPFPKFFNYGEVDRDMLPGGPVTVTEKMDGSLGILYQHPDGGLAIATRGSFTSEQAIHATNVLRTRYSDFQPPVGFTYLFEIVYPENRIVVDYGELDELILLDVINTETGYSAPAGRAFWRGPEAAHHDHLTSLIDVLRAPERSNHEGFVVYFERTGERVKVKHEEYVRLHRIITNVNEKTIWEILSTGGDVNSLLQQVPDEFYHWVRNQILSLTRKHRQIADLAIQEYLSIVGLQCPPSVKGLQTEDPKAFRRWYAGKAQKSEHRDLLFMLLDNKPTSDAIWKKIKPSGAKTFAKSNEDAA